jgi:hypothetical protein
MNNFIITFDTLPGHGMGWVKEHADQDEAWAAFENCRGKRHDGIERITLAEARPTALVDLASLEPDADGLFVDA